MPLLPIHQKLYVVISIKSIHSTLIGFEKLQITLQNYTLTYIKPESKELI